jgi:hypothetical protein
MALLTKPLVPHGTLAFLNFEKENSPVFSIGHELELSAKLLRLDTREWSRSPFGDVHGW